jgi:urease accessory protein
MMRLTLLSLAILFTGLIGPAAAHSPIKGIGTFYNGLLHPVLVPEHLLVLVAVGLLIGQHAPKASRYALPAFAAAVALALILTSAGPLALPSWPILAVALFAGLAVARAWSHGRAPALILAALAGALVGLDSTPDGIPRDQFWLALSGTGLGMTLVITYLGGLAAWLDRPWQKIAVRALGSWIAASAILVLTLDLMKPASTPA